MKSAFLYILLVAAIFGLDYVIDLPDALSFPEVFDCVEDQEVATGEKDRGFQFCLP